MNYSKKYLLYKVFIVKSSFSHNHGFTLIEMIVVIMLIGIFTLWATSVDFSRLSMRQEQAVFTNDIIQTLQTVKNYAFQGKAVGNPLETPDTWKVQISPTWNWAINTSYSLSTVSNNYPSLSFSAEQWYTIWSIICKSFDRTISEQVSSAVSITFSGDDMSVSGCSSNTYKILEISTSHAGFSDVIEINTVNGVIQKVS